MVISASDRLWAAAILALAALCVAIARRPSPVHGSSKLPYLIPFLINVVSVSIPGRFDSDADPAKMDMFPWPTLFSPAGWAFAIWGVIYLGELAGVLTVLRSEGTPLEVSTRASNDSWLAANCAQALWCAAFRPWALEQLWLSTAVLAVAAYCLYDAQRRLVTSAACRLLPRGTLVAVVWPRSLHLGWLLAAALVNLNAYVGKAAFGPAAALVAAIASVGAAAVAGFRLTAAGLPVATGALCWALLALSRGAPVGADAAALGAAATAGLAKAELWVALALGVRALTA